MPRQLEGKLRMSQRMLAATGAVAVVCVLFGYALWKQMVPPPPGKQAGAAAQTNGSQRGDDSASDDATASSDKPALSSSQEAGAAAASDDTSGNPESSTASAIASANAPSKPRKMNRHKDEPPRRPPLFDGWKPPAAMLVLSGEMHGYVEPCGCSANQIGGLSRRADLFRQIREREWPVMGLDVGGLVNFPTKRQAKIKLGMALEALRELQYSGIALGVEELQTGIDILQYREEDRPPFLSANVVLFGMVDQAGFARMALVSVGNLKIGITAVFGDSYKFKVANDTDPAGGNPDLQILNPVEALTSVVAELEAQKPDLLVLLSHCRVEETQQLVENFPQFDLAVSAGGPEDPNPRPKYHGKTLLVTPGQKGKNVAVVGYYPDETENRFRFDAVALDEVRFQETPAMHAHMRRYQEALEVQSLVAGEPAIDDPRNAEITDANDYVGASVCGECHTKAFRHWQTTGHAKATASLKVGRSEHADWFVPRMNDPECIACHVTGWSPKDPYYRYKSGFTSETATPHLLGNQCENCHGPGGRHVELERQFHKDRQETDELQKFREFVQIFSDQAGAKLCVHCHDDANDPHFKTDGDVYEEYWNEIRHPWRD
ncbi:MAG: multiheme c-type cytochrome [Planctomycetales bacterium]